MIGGRVLSGNMVLIVEEDETIAQELGAAMVDWGYDVVIAKNVREARVCLNTAHFDLVISENEIPELNEPA